MDVEISINQTALNNIVNVWQKVVNVSAVENFQNESVMQIINQTVTQSENFWIDKITTFLVDYNYLLALAIGFIFWRYLGDIPLAIGTTCIVMLTLNVLLLPFMYGEQIVSTLVVYGLGFIASLAWIAYRRIRHEE